MKRCPTCNRSYDDSQQFCLEDGAPLVSGTGTFDPQATIMSPPPNVPARPSTPAAESSPGNWPQNPSWPATGPSQAAPSPNKRRVWPWVVGVLAVLVLGITAVVGIGIYVAYRSAETVANTNANSNSNVNTNTKANTNINTNTSTNANTNTNTETRNNNLPPANTNNANSSGTDENAPSDEDEVLDQLEEMENDWADANVKADKQALGRILADEFVGTAGDGTVEKKAQYIANIQPDNSIKSQTFSDLDLSLRGNTAILTGINTVKFSNGASQRYRFTDTFVWRDGRWQAISSQASRVK